MANTSVAEHAFSSEDIGVRRGDTYKSSNAFTYSDSLITSLQRVLVNLIDLHVQGKQAHWNVVGPQFRSLHLEIDELVAVAVEQADVVAERIRALHAVPDGRAATVAQTSELPAYPSGEIDSSETAELLVERIDKATRIVRDVRENVDDEDAPSGDLLNNVLNELEQHSWFIGATLGKRN